MLGFTKENWIRRFRVFSSMLESVGAYGLTNTKLRYTRRVYSVAPELDHLIRTRHSLETFEKK